jgi:hypothetical protein
VEVQRFHNVGLDNVLKRGARVRRTRTGLLFPMRVDHAVLQAPQPWRQTFDAATSDYFRRWKDHDSYQKAFERLTKDFEGRCTGN